MNGFPRIEFHGNSTTAANSRTITDREFSAFVSRDGERELLPHFHELSVWGELCSAPRVQFAGL